MRYLENRLLAEAAKVKRFKLEQNQSSGSKLPESDREDMEVFLLRIRQLLPVPGSDLLEPLVQNSAMAQLGGLLYCRIKGAEARGQRTPNGFVVVQGSTAVFEERPSIYPYVTAERAQLRSDGSLVKVGGVLKFTRDVEFASPSSAASVIQGGSANGLLAWKTQDGKSLKRLDEGN